MALVAWGRSFGIKVAHTFPIVMDDHVTEQDKTKLAVIRPAVSLENGALQFLDIWLLYFVLLFV